MDNDSKGKLNELSLALSLSVNASFPKHFREEDKSPENIYNKIKSNSDENEFALITEHAYQMSSVISAFFIEQNIINCNSDITNIYWTSIDDKDGIAGDHEKLTGVNDPYFDGDLILEIGDRRIGISAKYGNTKSPTLKNPGCSRLEKIFGINLRSYMDKHIQYLYDLGYSGSNDEMKEQYKSKRDTRMGLEARRSGLETRHMMIGEIHKSMSRLSSDQLREIIIELCAPNTHTELYRSQTYTNGSEVKHFFNHSQRHVLDTLENYSKFEINKEHNSATAISIYGIKKYDSSREPVMTITIKFKSGPLKDWGGKITCPMLNKKKKKRVLYAFDLDETLFHYPSPNYATIYVRSRDDDSLIHKLTNQEYNNYVLETGNYFDYREFENSKIFQETARPIQKMLDKMISLIEKGKRVEIVTARSDFDDRDLFLKVLQDHGIDTSKIHVRRCGNHRHILTAYEAKQYVFRELIREFEYDEIYFWDDNIWNLNSFLQLKDLHPELKLHAYHVEYINDKLKVKKYGTE